jgi:hypothetical protein
MNLIVTFGLGPTEGHVALTTLGYIDLSVPVVPGGGDGDGNYGGSGIGISLGKGHSIGIP